MPPRSRLTPGGRVTAWADRDRPMSPQPGTAAGWCPRPGAGARGWRGWLRQRVGGVVVELDWGGGGGGGCVVELDCGGGGGGDWVELDCGGGGGGGWVVWLGGGEVVAGFVGWVDCVGAVGAPPPPDAGAALEG